MLLAMDGGRRDETVSGKPIVSSRSQVDGVGMTSSRWDFDVAVVGGGPGGSSAATALARRGKRVVLLERDRFPRFHIGESQLPWSNEVFRALGADQAIVAAGFVKKWGASFRPPDRETEQYADFEDAVETPTPQTFQVQRERFDEVLLRHSERCGVTVREGHRLLDAAFDAEAVTLRFAGPEGTERTARVGVVVDASGRAGVVVKRFGRHEYDPLLRNIAFHAQYEGIPRAEGRRAGDIRMFTRPDMGWLWLIPLSDTVTSVGAVIPKAVHISAKRRRPPRRALPTI
jgi:FADH2-dependent halogenase